MTDNLNYTVPKASLPDQVMVLQNFVQHLISGC